MAQTSAAVQTVLGTNAMSPQIIRDERPLVGTVQRWYVVGGAAYPGRVRWVEKTASDSAATQGAAILTALLA
jgi:hypothetical protein